MNQSDINAKYSIMHIINSIVSIYVEKKSIFFPEKAYMLISRTDH